MQGPEELSYLGLALDSLAAEAGIRPPRSPFSWWVSSGEKNVLGNKAGKYPDVSCAKARQNPGPGHSPTFQSPYGRKRMDRRSTKIHWASHQGLNEWESLDIRDQIKDFKASQG